MLMLIVGHGNSFAFVNLRLGDKSMMGRGSGYACVFETEDLYESRYCRGLYVCFPTPSDRAR